jgi:hypothetical protein
VAEWTSFQTHYFSENLVVQEKNKKTLLTMWKDKRRNKGIKQPMFIALLNQKLLTVIRLGFSSEVIGNSSKGSFR